MIPAILESGGAKSRSSLQRSLYSTSSSPSSSSRMLEAETMEEERREVRELPLELLNSDMGEMQEERPGQSLVGKLSGEESQPDMEEIPLSLWLWLWRGLDVDSCSVQHSVGEVGWIGPPWE